MEKVRKIVKGILIGNGLLFLLWIIAIVWGIHGSGMEDPTAPILFFVVVSLLSIILYEAYIPYIAGAVGIIGCAALIVYDIVNKQFKWREVLFLMPLCLFNIVGILLVRHLILALMSV